MNLEMGVARNIEIDIDTEWSGNERNDIGIGIEIFNVIGWLRTREASR